MTYQEKRVIDFISTALLWGATAHLNSMLITDNVMKVIRRKGWNLVLDKDGTHDYKIEPDEIDKKFAEALKKRIKRRKRKK